MNIRTAAHLLGGTVCGHNRILCPGPGHTRRDRSLSVAFVGADEPIVHSFAGDDWRACKDHVARLLGLPEWRRRQDVEEVRRHEAKRALRAKTEAETEAKNTRIARLIWNGGVDPRGTAAELYLKSRRLALTADACAVLRFHPAAKWGVDPDHPEFPPGRHPTLLAAFQDIETDKLTGIHRVRVDQPRLWPRTRRKMLGRVSGSAVKLADVPDGILAVGEGIETAIAANADGLRPGVGARLRRRDRDAAGARGHPQADPAGRERRRLPQGHGAVRPALAARGPRGGARRARSGDRPQ